MILRPPVFTVTAPPFPSTTLVRSPPAEPPPARPLPARSRREGGHGDQRPRALQPHQSGAAAAVSADRHRREGGKAVPLDHRAPPRHARRHHQGPAPDRSEEHTSELQSLMRISYAVF